MKKVIIFYVLIICVKVNLSSQAIEIIGNPIFEFSPGIHFILDYPVNIRSEPSLMGYVIGRLGLHSEIEILKKTENSQIISGLNHFWYEIRYGNIIGYIWGGFIAVTRTILIVDNVEIVCYFRISNMVRIPTGRVGMIQFYHYFESFLPNDIFIYINNERVSIRVFEEVFNTFGFYAEYSFWQRIFFLDGRTPYNIFVSCLGPGINELMFNINSLGSIEFFGAGGP